MGHGWPGNVGGLGNVVERASVLDGGETRGADEAASVLDPTAVPAPWLAVSHGAAAMPGGDDGEPAYVAHPKSPAPGRPIDLKREIETVELEQIHVAPDLADGIFSAPARLLSLKRPTLTQKLRKSRVPPPADLTAAPPFP